MTEGRGYQEHGSKTVIYLSSLVAAMGGFLFGYIMVIVSGAIIFMKKEFSLSDVQVGFAITSLQIGCIAGPVIAGAISDRWGRKLAFLLSALFFLISSIGAAVSRNMVEFNLFRIVGGIGVGLVSVVTPMYIAEISPRRIRGSLVSLNQFAIVTGVLMCYLTAYFLSFSGNWRLMFGSALLPAIVFLVGICFIPQSPRWLAQKNRLPEALHVLTQIDGRKNAELEIQAMESAASEKSGTVFELFQPGARKALLIGTALCFFQAWCGMTAIIFYSPIIYQKAGFAGASDAIFQALLLNILAFFCTVAALFLVDRAGRKPLLLIGTAGLALSQIVLGLCFQINLTGRFIVVALFLCNIFYQISLAPLAWLILSEIFPIRVRALGQSAGALIVWISNCLVTQVLGPLMGLLERSFGSAAGAFWVFSAVCAGAFIFGWRLIPETKGKSLEEIADFWGRKAKAVGGRW
jgi:SP family arabinose:H+ symporter-like MFS transporter